jgi:hypothetical protein
MSAILVDPLYNPNLASSITSATKLAPGVTIAKFLGAYGDRTSLNFIIKNDERQQLARNLYLHGIAIDSINGNTTHFNDVRLIVSEGIFNGRNVPAAADNKKKKDGELVYYQVIDREGNIDYEKTFDVAVYWKDFIRFKEIRLDYDTYNPDGTLCASIGLLMPSVPESFEVTFDQKVTTYFNNKLQSKNELVEILEIVE